MEVMTERECQEIAAGVTVSTQPESNEMIPIKEYYVVDKECKNSVRYKARSKNSPLAGMTIYVPRAIINSDSPPAELLMTMQVHIQNAPSTAPTEKETEPTS